MWLTEHVAHMEQLRNAYAFFVREVCREEKDFKV
jgi:hypothetical protein